MRTLLLTCLFVLHLIAYAQPPRVVHVIVALCDNQHQGIVKVPAGIGNGQNPRTNLYWGAGYGVRTHFDRSPEWQRVPCAAAMEEHILDRAVWKHRDSAVYLVADAYDGRHIRKATEDLLLFASGQGTIDITCGTQLLQAGGRAHLAVYVGHDGLMDFSLDRAFHGTAHSGRQAIVLACASQRFFSGPLRSTGAYPLLWTTGLMAPEAYTLRAALQGWVAKETAAAIEERAAQAYHTYQKCGIKGARRLFATGW